MLKSITYPTKGKSEFVYELGTFSYVPETTTGISSGAVELSNYDENELNWDATSASTAFNNFSSVKKYAFNLTEPVNVKILLGASSINQYAYQFRVFRKKGQTILQLVLQERHYCLMVILNQQNMI